MTSQNPPAPQPPTSAPPAAPYPYGHPVAPPGAGRPERPLGVSLLGVLYSLGTAMLFLVALLFIVGGTVLAGFLLNLISGLGGQMGALGGVFMVVLGIMMAVFGGLFLLVTLGIFKGSGWAWTTVLILQAVGAASNLLGALDGDYTAIVWMAVPLLIIWYLFEPAPKAFFGKSHVRAFWQKADAPPQ